MQRERYRQTDNRQLGRHRNAGRPTETETDAGRQAHIHTERERYRKRD